MSYGEIKKVHRWVVIPCVDQCKYFGTLAAVVFQYLQPKLMLKRDGTEDDALELTQSPRIVCLVSFPATLQQYLRMATALIKSFWDLSKHTHTSNT